MKKEGMGRIRLHVTLDCTAYSLETFILENIEPGSNIATDSLRSYSFLDKGSYVHEKNNQSRTKDYENLYGVHLVTPCVRIVVA